MKTPEQIAEDYADTIRWDTRDRAVVTESAIRDLIRDAIEADRAQRRIILTATDEPTPWRVWVATPREVFEQMQYGLEIGRSLDEWAWEEA